MIFLYTVIKLKPYIENDIHLSKLNDNFQNKVLTKWSVLAYAKCNVYVYVQVTKKEVSNEYMDDYSSSDDSKLPIFGLVLIVGWFPDMKIDVIPFISSTRAQVNLHYYEYLNHG